MTGETVNTCQRKGIILAGGSGTRLWPITAAVSKQLLPVWDKPMIYYPLATLMLSGLREILVISTPNDLPKFQLLLGNGSDFGISLHYAEQRKPNGIAEAMIIAENFLEGQSSALILGDNIFHGHGLQDLLIKTVRRNNTTIFASEVHDPERYGVVGFDQQFKANSIEEKPDQPKSKFAATGLYFYDKKAPELAKSLSPSTRGELEITDLNRLYMQSEELTVELLDRGTTWLDTGTVASLMQAGQFVEAIQTRQGTVIACLEEIALDQEWINYSALEKRIPKLGTGLYAEYIRRLLKKDSNPDAG